MNEIKNGKIIIGTPASMQEIFYKIIPYLNHALSTIGKTSICPIVEDVTLSLFYKRFSPYPQLLFFS